MSHHDVQCLRKGGLNFSWVEAVAQIKVSYSQIKFFVLETMDLDLSM